MLTFDTDLPGALLLLLADALTEPPSCPECGAAARINGHGQGFCFEDGCGLTWWADALAEVE